MKKNTASKNDGGKKRGGEVMAGCRAGLISWDDCPVWLRDEKERKEKRSDSAVIFW